jgi:peptidyl-prolyl cis-trans isomerase B (cyclophilin B)
MRIASAFLVGSTVIAVLLISAGCAKKTDSGPEAKAAAITGSGAANGSGSSSAAQNKAQRPAASADPDHPVVELQTSMGSIVVELDASQAPWTVRNFLRYVESGHYDQTIFHQVLRDYAIMGGGFTPDLIKKKAHPSIRNEAQKCALKNVAGTIAMVRTPDAPDSATCQFFINVSDNPQLDYRGPNPDEYGYCPFGKITSGMDVVKKIAEVEVTDKTVEVSGQSERKTERVEFERLPKESVVLQSVRRIR